MINYGGQRDIYFELAFTPRGHKHGVVYHVVVLHYHFSFLSVLFGESDPPLKGLFVLLFKDDVESGDLFLEGGIVQPSAAVHFILRVE